MLYYIRVKSFRCPISLGYTGLLHIYPCVVGYSIDIMYFIRVLSDKLLLLLCWIELFIKCPISKICVRL
jgi:hypothetical protein